jgi:hypothetical protein
LGDLENALKHAMIEYKRRPENIEVCEVLAWVNYKMGDYETAKLLIDKALRTNSMNPSLLVHAEKINQKTAQL